MKILASSDIRHLETLLLERVDRSTRSGGGSLFDPLLILVPTGRLAVYLKRRILAHRRAAAGVHIVTHHGFAARTLEHALELPPRVLAPSALAHLLNRLLAGCAADEASYLRQHAGARRALAGTFEELREAGVDATRLETVLGQQVPSWFGDLFRRFEEGLDGLCRIGWTDSAGLTKRALPHAGRFLAQKRLRAIVHYGAYELTGANVELLEALGEVADVEFFLPCELGPPAHRYAERFVELLRRRGLEPVVAQADDREKRRRGAGGPRDWIRRLTQLYTTAEAQRTQRRAGKAARSRGGRPVAAGSLTQLDWITAPRIDEARGVAETRSSGDFEAADFDGPALELRHTQGTQAELRAAALRALALHHQSGIPWSEIAVVARSLEPYAPFLDQTFESLGVPFTTSAALPLRRAPDIDTFLGLLRVYARDFERGSVITLLRRGGLAVAGGPPASGEIDRWDRWSRRHRIVGGLSEWRELRTLLGPGDASAAPSTGVESPSADASDARRTPPRPSLERLLEILDDLAEDASAWRAARSLEEHLSILESIGRRRLAPSDPAGNDGDASESRTDAKAPDIARSASAQDGRTGQNGHSPHLDRLLDILRSLGDIERALEAPGRHLRTSSETSPGASLEMSTVLEWIEDAAAETSVVIGRGDDTGVRVLDLMQARGLSHRVVQWLGFHHGGFPRVGRADPYLPDSERARLREVAGAPIGLALETRDEERILFSMTLASAGELLCLSYQRADEAGRKKARSSALREVARVFTGRADVRGLDSLLAPAADGVSGVVASRRPHADGIDGIPAHCGERAASLAASPRFGILPVMDAVVAAAVNARDPARQSAAMLEALDASSPHRVAALEWLSRVEEFGTSRECDPLDGLTGLGVEEGWEFSSTALEHLTNCPQAYFLRYLLGVRELDDEPEPHRLAVQALGTAVHDTLEALYDGLRARGAFGRDRHEATRLALDLLPELWTDEFDRAGGPSLRRLPGLARLLGHRWLDSLRGFVVKDIEAIFAAGVEPVDFETTQRAILELRENLHLRALGRIDRVLRGRDRTFVDDYKTSGNLFGRVRAANLLQGRNLQLPLYREIIAAATTISPEEIQARCLGVGPEFEGDRRTEAALAWDAKVRTGFLETVAVCLELARSGRFPLNERSSRCSWCAYRSTCRRSHEPTVHRLENDPRLRDYFDLGAKTRTEVTLEEVRRKRDEMNPTD